MPIPEGSSGRTRIRRGEPELIFPDHRHFAFILAQEAWLAEQDLARTVIAAIGPGEELTNVLHESGTSPDEYDYEVTVQVRMSDLDDRAERDPASLPPLRSLYAAANARARAMMMEAQRLTTRLDRITVPDLALVMGALDHVFATSVPVNPQSASASTLAARVRETCVFLSISLVTGTKPECLRGLPDIGMQDFATLRADWAIAFGRARNASVWVRPYRRPDRAPLADAHRHHPIATWPHVALRDVWGVGAHMGNAQDRKWFHHSIEYYRTTFQNEIRPVFARAGVPLRWQRFEAMAEIIPSWFLGLEEGDQLRTAVLFDRDDRYASTQHYYAVISRTALDEGYVKEMTGLWGRVQSAGFASNSGLFALQNCSDPLDASWVGDDRVPKVPALKVVAAALKRQLEQFRPERVSDPGSITYHNALATYVAFMLAVVTGCRAVRTPFPDLGLMDEATGFLCVHEKDTRDGSHARIIWLPPRIRSLIDCYLRHAQIFLVRQSGNLRATTLTVPATKARDRSRFNGDSYQLWLPRTIFFVESSEGGSQYVEWTGMSLRSRIEAVAPGHWFVDNAGRHFLRSFLAHRGCAATVINAHLGHWHHGESPWMPESTFDPYHYRSEIEPHLEALADALERAD